MAVPFLDLAGLHAPLRRELAEAFDAVLADSSFILGNKVEVFEQEFAARVGREHCIGVNSGTSALHLALLGAGVGPGDEVITTPHTWISTTWAVSYCGATPVFVDVDPDTGNIDPRAVERAITRKTRAIVPVDLYGNPCELDALTAIARSHGLALVDDACQAHGSTYLGRPVGAYGDLACFSFYPGKNLGALGEGGAIVTNDAEVAARLRHLRDHGQDTRHRHAEIGFNYRMDGLQGAFLSVKLAHLDAWNKERSAAAQRYLEHLSPLRLQLPTVTRGGDSNWHLFVVRSAERDELRAALEKRQIQTGIHYPVPVHLQPAYSFLAHVPGAFPNAEEFARSCLSLPLFPGITAQQQDDVIEALRAALS